jgi:hypothetical protein
MTDKWRAPDLYEGTLKLPESPPQAKAPGPAEPDAFARIAAAIEALYEREPHRTRQLLNELRAASTADLERLFTA